MKRYIKIFPTLFLLLLLAVSQPGMASETAVTFYGGEIPGPDHILLLGPMYFSLPSTEVVAPEAPAAPQPIPPAEEVVEPVLEAKPEETATSTTMTTTTTTIIVTTTTTEKSITTSTTTTSTTATIITTTTSTTTTTLLPEAAPQIKIWFDNRLYQKTLVDKGEKFIVSKQPKIKMEVNIPSPYTLNENMVNYSILVDSNTENVKTLAVTPSQIIQKSGASNKLSSLTIEYPIAYELSPGSHTFEFIAKSSGSKGIPATAVLKTEVTVSGGEIRLADTPITFPSPFSPSKNKEGIIIQYTLSSDADIEIYIFSIAGETIKKISCISGSEGGSAGLNKVKWNGVMDKGGVVGNGIYMGTIVSKAEGKKLGKFKLSVFD